MSEETLFQKIICGKLPADKVFESDMLIAIKDIFPVAPVHILIIPKKMIPDLQSVQKEDAKIIAEVIELTQMLAKRFDILDGYRLLTNNGRAAGQSIFHLHFHLIGGKILGAIG